MSMQTAHNYQAGQIIAMDKTPIWSDMVSHATVDGCGKKTITLKITDHEKSHMSVCLAAKVNGAVREAKALSEEFKGKVVIASSLNAWMNTDLAHV